MAEPDCLTRRSFLKGAAAVAALASTGSVLAACGSSESSTASTGTASDSSSDSASSEATQDAAFQNSETQDAASSEPTTAAEGSVLVVYYSAQGHTEAVANAIADELGAPTFAITPVSPYSEDDLNWRDENSRVTTQYENEDQRVVDLQQVIPDGFDGYTTVLVGYPIWWGSAAWPVNQFIEGNDFSGKTVIPFCTSASSPIGDSGELLAEAAGAGAWQEGRRFASGASESDARAWAQGLGL